MVKDLEDAFDHNSQFVCVFVQQVELSINFAVTCRDFPSTSGGRCT